MEQRIENCMDLDLDLGLSLSFGIVKRAVTGISGVAEGCCRRFALRKITSRTVSNNMSFLLRTELVIDGVTKFAREGQNGDS
jgi:hypothetical protein